MPIYYWFRLTESSDTKHLIKRKIRIFLFKKYLLNIFYVRLFDSYLKRFGLGENMTDIIAKQKEIAALQVENITLGNDAFRNACLDICAIELDMLKSNGDSERNFYESKVYLEKVVGHQIDIMRTTVTEYYSIIRTVSKMKPDSYGGE